MLPGGTRIFRMIYGIARVPWVGYVLLQTDPTQTSRERG